MTTPRTTLDYAADALRTALTPAELRERLRSATRRMGRYARMGNDALFALAKFEYDSVTLALAETAKRRWAK